MKLIDRETYLSKLINLKGTPDINEKRQLLVVIVRGTDCVYQKIEIS